MDGLPRSWQGVTELLTDSTKLATGIAGVTLLALGIYSTREGVRVAGRTFDRWFGTPALVRLSLKFRLAGGCYIHGWRPQTAQSDGAARLPPVLDRQPVLSTCGLPLEASNLQAA